MLYLLSGIARGFLYSASLALIFPAPSFFLAIQVTTEIAAASEYLYIWCLRVFLQFPLG